MVGNHVVQVKTAVLISTGRYTINAAMERERSAQDVHELVIRSCGHTPAITDAPGRLIASLWALQSLARAIDIETECG